jgi:hypothetical protein
MRRLVPLTAACGSLLLALIGSVGPTQADVGVTQEAKLVGEKPVSGRYSIKYNDYGPDRGTYCPPRSPHCVVQGRPVARGKLQTKLSVYKIKDGMRKFDYYLLDVDMVTADRYGAWKMGGVAISVTNVGPRLVDRNDTRSLSAEENECHSVDVGLSTPWPVISASADLGSVTWCTKKASLRLSSAGNWVLQGLGSTRHMAVDRAVKVRAGAKPRFKVTIVVPKDTCTRALQGKCIEFDNGASSATYRVGSSG